MKNCWVCGNKCDVLSKEHIVPKLFGGITTTDAFSCRECNHLMGKKEQAFTPLSTFMHYLDNSEGAPETTLPTRGARNKETKFTYADAPAIQLSSSGTMQFEDWESPSGKRSADQGLWIHTRIPLSLRLENLHKSMVKAITALACRIGFSRDYFRIAQEYLSGNDGCLDDLRPLDLGLPPQEMFATVWIFSPPSRRIRTIYGAAVYGPIGFLYSLRSDTRLNSVPFFGEVKAYKAKHRLGVGGYEYEAWCRTTMEKARQQAESMLAYRMGPYNVKRPPESSLFVVEVSEALSESNPFNLYVPQHRLESTHGWGSRFGNWLKTIYSEEVHTQFLSGIAEMDAASNQI